MIYDIELRSGTPRSYDYGAKWGVGIPKDSWQLYQGNPPDAEPEIPCALWRVVESSGKIRFSEVGDVKSQGANDLVIVETKNRGGIHKEPYLGKFIKPRSRRNHRRENTHGWNSVQIVLNYLIRTGATAMCTELFRVNGGRIQDLKWDLDHGHFDLVDESGVIGDWTPKDAPAPAGNGTGVKAEENDTLNEFSFEVSPDEILPQEFQRIMSLASVNQNILMVGPSGSGKTYLASKIAEKLGRDFASQSCSAGMSESQLTGWLLPIGESGRFSYVPSAFVTTYEQGGVFLFDEIDASDENTLIFINAALAGDNFYLPQRFDSPRVNRHQNFVAVAAANTLGLGEDNVYVGRTQLDGATLDRFRAGVVHVDYSPEVEEKLVDPEVLVWGRHIRRFINERKLDRIMSTRVMLDFTTQKKTLGYKRGHWESSYFADWSKEELSQLRSA